MPATVIFEDDTLDYAILKAPTPRGQHLDIDCSGFVRGEDYVSVGYPGDIFVARYLTATGQLAEPWGHLWSYWRGQRLLLGTVIPGMSGGPVVSLRSGKVVGITNGYDTNVPHSFSRQLKDTYLCAKRS